MLYELIVPAGFSHAGELCSSTNLFSFNEMRREFGLPPVCQDGVTLQPPVAKDVVRTPPPPEGCRPASSAATGGQKDAAVPDIPAVPKEDACPQASPPVRISGNELVSKYPDLSDDGNLAETPYRVVVNASAESGAGLSEAPMLADSFYALGGLPLLKKLRGGSVSRKEAIFEILNSQLVGYSLISMQVNIVLMDTLKPSTLSQLVTPGSNVRNLLDLKCKMDNELRKCIDLENTMSMVSHSDVVVHKADQVNIANVHRPEGGECHGVGGA